MAVLALIVWALLFLAFAGGERGMRESAILAFMTVTAGVLVATELLSLPRLLWFWPVVGVWIAGAACVAIGLRRRIAAGIARLRSTRVGLDRWSALVAAVLAFFALGTLLSAALYPTTNYDSLTYHMPRVFFWFQNHSVAHYPTSEGRQLFSSALVEYWVLQLKILSAGSDRLANVVQWLSYVFAIVAASLVAERLGAGRRGQQVAAVAAAATPMAVLQASTTQNDLTCALWSLVAVYWMLRFTSRAEDEGVSVGWWALAIGGAIALATQTKPTAYVFMAPILAWSAVAAFQRVGWKRTLALGGVSAVVFLLLSVGWYIGNARSLGPDVLGLSAPGNTHILIKQRTPEAFTTNSLKNSSMLLGTPSSAANSVIATSVRGIVRAYGGNVENNLTKEDPAEQYVVDARVIDHDVAPSPLTVALILAAAVALAFARGRSARFARWYVLSALVALFLTAGLITWNHFINRVLLGAELLAIPAIGVAVTMLTRDSRRAGRAVLGLLLGLSVMWGTAAMLFNTTNRLVPPGLIPVRTANRDLGYWNTSYADLRFRVLVPQYESPMKRIASVAKSEGIERIGLDVRSPNFPVYPLLALLPDRHFEYVRDLVKLPDLHAPAATPEAIVEVVWADEYPAALNDGRVRGEMLVPPTRGGDRVFLMYRPE